MPRKASARGGRHDAEGAGPTGKRDFFRQLNECSLSPTHGKIARHLAESYRIAASQTAAQVAAAIGTSEATVIRFALRLGYEGYPALRRHLYRMVHEDLTSIELLHRPLPQRGTRGGRDTLTRVVQTEIKHLQTVVADLSREEFSRLVKSVCDAPRVYVVGHRAAAALATFLGYTLAKVHPDVVTLAHGGTREYDVFHQVPSGTWMVAIAFPRYPRETLAVMDFAREEGISIGAITDRALSPVAKRADVVLPVPAEPVSFVDSYGAPQVVVGAFLVEYGLRARDRTEARLRRFEQLATRQATFYAGD